MIFLKVTKLKIFTTVFLVVCSNTLPLLFYRINGSFEFARQLLFPIKIYHFIASLLRNPGYDDIQYGECIVYFCDQWAGIIAILISLIIYFLTSCLIIFLFTKKKRS